MKKLILLLGLTLVSPVASADDTKEFTKFVHENWNRVKAAIDVEFRTQGGSKIGYEIEKKTLQCVGRETF